MHIVVTKGLDIPIKGAPSGEIVHTLPTPSTLSLNLAAFDDLKGRLLVKVQDKVLKGQPLVEDKECPGRMFVAPCAGEVIDIRRGLKRKLLDIVIRKDQKEESVVLDQSLNLIDKLKVSGFFACIKKRPFDHLADPNVLPRSIFVLAIESLPFCPPAELQLKGHEKAFQAGLDALSELSCVHLMTRRSYKASSVQVHTVEGPHPAANASLHIQSIDPIYSIDDVVWTILARDVVKIGYFLTQGIFFFDQVIGIGGPGILPGKTGFFKVCQGYPIKDLIEGRCKSDESRIISGDPLTGEKVEITDYIHFFDRAVSCIPEDKARKFLHFMRPTSGDEYSFSRAYLGGKDREYSFSTRLHGEERSFIDSVLYDKVMPLHISTMPLVKAVMAEDFDLAEELGLLQVVPEDFSLPAFVCPSKIEMPEIIRDGLKKYVRETG